MSGLVIETHGLVEQSGWDGLGYLSVPSLLVPGLSGTFRRRDVP